MTHPRTEALLKKINYIEADVEIHKQILFSIPSDKTEEMERIIELIASRKKEIESLRKELYELDPEEHQRIVTFENALAEFKKIASETPFEAIIDRKVNEPCSLSLQGDKVVECLIKACDRENNWTVITVDGEIRRFPAAEVAERPPEKSDQ